MAQFDRNRQSGPFREPQHLPHVKDQETLTRMLEAASRRPDLLPEGFMAYLLDYVRMNLLLPIEQVVGGYGVVQDEGTALTKRKKIDFAGAGVTATDDASNNRTLVTIAGGAGGYATVQDEGSALPAQTTLDFTGTGVTATDDAANNRTLVSIPGSTGWDTVSAKSSDTSVSTNAAYTSESELSFATVSGGIYEIELVVIYANPLGGTTPDIQFVLGEDATTRGFMHAWALNAAESPIAYNTAVNTSTAFVMGTAATNRATRLSIGGYWAGGGTFVTKWAQQTNSGTQPTILRAGSVLRYRRVV